MAVEEEWGEQSTDRYLDEVTPKDAPKDWAEYIANAKKKKKIAKESRVLVDAAETLLAATFHSHLESVSAEGRGRG